MFELTEMVHDDLASVAESISPSALLAMVLYTQATPQMASWLWGIWDQLPALTLLPGADAQLSESPGGPPIGSVIMFAAETAPEGYIEADGRALSKASYPELFNVLGERYSLLPDGPAVFRIPDLRGVFPRFWDHGRGIDVDSSGRLDSGNGTTGDHVGTRQNFAIAQHIHTVGPNIRVAASSGNTHANNGYHTVPFGTSSFRITIGISDVRSAVSSSENRPTNINLLPLIRALYPADPILEDLTSRAEAAISNISQFTSTKSSSETTSEDSKTQKLALIGTVLGAIGATALVASIGMFARTSRRSHGRAVCPPLDVAPAEGFAQPNALDADYDDAFAVGFGESNAALNDGDNYDSIAGTGTPAEGFDQPNVPLDDESYVGSFSSTMN